MIDGLTVADRVDAGINLLNEKGPADWRSRIDTSILNLSSFGDCVLGQVFGSFDVGLVALGIDVATTGNVDAWRWGYDGLDFSELTAEWERRLAPSN